MFFLIAVIVCVTIIEYVSLKSFRIYKLCEPSVLDRDLKILAVASVVSIILVVLLY